jgi:hypothetical protein
MFYSRGLLVSCVTGCDPGRSSKGGHPNTERSGLGTGLSHYYKINAQRVMSRSLLKLAKQALP